MAKHFSVGSAAALNVCRNACAWFQNSSRIPTGCRRAVTLALLMLPVIAFTGAFHSAEHPAESNLLRLIPEDFRIEITATGRVESRKSRIVQSDCRWRTSIIELVPEGTWVQEGDVVCELDRTDIEASLRNWEIPLISARAALDASVQDELIQQSAGERAISQARFQLRKAANRLEEYAQGTWPVEVSGRERDVILCSQRMEQASSEFSHVEKLWSQGYASDRELAQAGYERDLRQEALRRSEQGLAFADGIQHDREDLTLNFEKSNAEREVLRAEISSSLAETTARMNTLVQERRMKIYQRHREYAQKSLDACTLRAPASGQIIYANSWDDLSRGVTSIAPGAAIHFQQAVFEIPDQTRHKVKVSIHESLITCVHPGMPVTVQVEGYASEHIAGEISEISRYSRPRNYFSPEVRDYTVSVILLPTPEQQSCLRLNMDASVTLTMVEKKQTLTVPSESVVGAVGLNFVWKLDGTRIVPQAVQLGEANDDHVCVVSGLSADDQIVASMTEQQRLELTKHLDDQLKVASR
jgi:HlyD family secretion protein